jgi:hypothetical protein
MAVFSRRSFRTSPGLRVLALTALWLGAGACLPGDERPPPGVVSVWLEGAEGLEARTPLVTDDGWSITFDQVLVASSGVEDREEEGAEDDGGGGLFGTDNDDGGPLCTFYYETSMRAVYDLVVPGPRPLGHFGGLGVCAFEVDWGRLGPTPDLVGPGVSVDQLRRIVEGLLATGVRGTPGLYVAGVASKGDLQKTFALPFSPRFLYSACGYGRAALASQKSLEANVALETVITVHPEWLFSDTLREATPFLRFDPLANADIQGDDDGEVTRAELEKIPLADLTGVDGIYVWPAGVPQPTDLEGVPRQASYLDFINLLAGRTFYTDGRDPCSAPPLTE